MDEYSNYGYQSRFNIKLLLIYVLKKWRRMLAAALVLTVLFGGAITAKGFIDLQDPEKVEESILESELALQNYETAKSQLTAQMAEYNRQIDSQQKYQENSLYMKLDPYAVYKESVSYLITTDYQIMPGMSYQNPNWMEPVLSAYVTVVTNVTFSDLSPEAKAGLSEEWDSDILDKLVRLETNVSEGRFTVIVSAEKPERAKAILKTLREKIEERQKDISQIAGEHQLNVVSEMSTVTVDQRFIDDRETRVRSLASLRDAADKAAEKYAALKEPKDKALSASNVIKKGIKFGIVGLLAGAFLTAFGYACVFMMDETLHDMDDVKYGFRSRVLAMIPESRGKNLIDRLISAMENSGRKQQSPETALHVAAVSLTAPEGKGRVAVSGTVQAEKLKEISDVLSRQAEGIEIINAGNILEDPEAARRMRSADAAVLVEQKDVSRCRDIERETELLDGFGVRLEGFIIL